MSYTMYDKGTYIASIVKQELSQTREKGTPQIVLTIQPLAVIDESTPAREECQPNADGQRRIYLYVTEKTADRVADQLRVIGFVGEKISDLDPRSRNHQSLVGHEIEVFCQHEEYKGDMKERWNISTGPMELEPLDGQKAREINNLMAKVLRQKPVQEKAARPARAASNGTAEAPAAAVASKAQDDGPTDDDLPF